MALAAAALRATVGFVGMCSLLLLAPVMSLEALDAASPAAPPQPLMAEAEYQSQRARILAHVDVAALARQTRPAYGLRVAGIPPNSQQAVALGIEIGDLVLEADGAPLLSVLPARPAQRARELRLFSVRSGTTRTVDAKPGPLGVMLAEDWRPDLAVLHRLAQPVPGRDDLLAACLSYRSDRVFAETALAHAQSAGLAAIHPFQALLTDILANTGRHALAIAAGHRAAEQSPHAEVGPLASAWFTACLAGARREAIDSDPRNFYGMTFNGVDGPPTARPTEQSRATRPCRAPHMICPGAASWPSSGRSEKTTTSSSRWLAAAWPGRCRRGTTSLPSQIRR